MAGTDSAGFIEFLLAQDVLKFGDFTLKSGRQSPYFINLGDVASGAGFATLGRAYAQAIVRAGLQFDVLFGPAYKGIPIAVATAVALAAEGMDVGVAYNRKEAKAHGEGGRMVGARITGKILMIDDVLTSGKAIREALSLIDPSDAQVAGAVIALDRQEILHGEHTAVEALQDEIAAPVISIAKMSDLILYLAQGTDANRPDLERMREYQAKYCRVMA